MWLCFPVLCCAVCSQVDVAAGLIATTAMATDWSVAWGGTRAALGLAGDNIIMLYRIIGRWKWVDLAAAGVLQDQRQQQLRWPQMWDLHQAAVLPASEVGCANKCVLLYNNNNMH